METVRGVLEPTEMVEVDVDAVVAVDSLVVFIDLEDKFQELVQRWAISTLFFRAA